MRKISVMFTFILLLGVSASMNAQSRWQHDFEGTLGSQEIGLTVSAPEAGKFPWGDNIECSYFYVSQLKDIKMSCSIDKDGNLSFKEIDAQGITTAVFTGKFLKNEIDNSEGIWAKTGDTKTLPFKLRFYQGVSSTDGNRYEQIEAKDPAVFESSVQGFRNAVLKGDKAKVASFIKYPINVTVRKKDVKIKNRTQLLQNYAGIFNKDFVNDLRKTVPHNMFCKFTGAMLGSGIVWFWGDGKVIGINN
jgi:hypothetical protein